MVRAGASIVVDESFLGGAASQQRWQRGLHGLDVLWVAVRCDAEVAAGPHEGTGSRVWRRHRQMSCTRECSTTWRWTPLTPSRSNAPGSSQYGRVDQALSADTRASHDPASDVDRNRAPTAWSSSMPQLQRLRAAHAPAVLAFERANRAYFASFVSDRGDEFFDHFTEQYDARMVEQEAGTCIFHVLIGEEGTVLGRFNLVDLENGMAKLGYRVAQHVAGQGVATATVREVCRLAAAEYVLRTLRAEATHENIASQKVLTNAGFVPVGRAEPGGRPGTCYQRDLSLA